MLHLRPVPTRYDFALDQIRRAQHERLRHEIEEAKMDAKLPRHFNERQSRRNGDME